MKQKRIKRMSNVAKIYHVMSQAKSTLVPAERILSESDNIVFPPEYGASKKQEFDNIRSALRSNITTSRESLKSIDETIARGVNSKSYVPAYAGRDAAEFNTFEVIQEINQWNENYLALVSPIVISLQNFYTDLSTINIQENAL